MQQTDAGSIVTLKCKLGSLWSVEIEFSDLSTLDQVHDAIQFAVEFDDDHLYEFFVARSERSRPQRRYQCDDPSISCTRLRDVFPLPSKHNLYYLFDYGDCWIFRISRSRKKPQTPAAGTNYPQVVNESGEKPMQYDIDDPDDW